MNTAQPIRDERQLIRFKNYFRLEEYHPRNHLLVTVGLNTALRISDILTLQWENVYDGQKQQFFEHICVTEQKTKKHSCVYVNRSIFNALLLYQKEQEKQGAILPQQYLFAGACGAPISRVQAYRIIRKAADGCGIVGTVSPHSLRKTFGYHAWKQGIPPVLLMDIYNHSSYAITKRYLGIEQDDRDGVFRNVCI